MEKITVLKTITAISCVAVSITLAYKFKRKSTNDS